MAISNDKLLNAVKLDLPGEYKDKIPTATKTNLLEIADIMIEYPTIKNAFLTRLVNKVGKTIIDNKVYQNRFKEFNRCSNYIESRKGKIKYIKRKIC